MSLIAHKDSQSSAKSSEEYLLLGPCAVLAENFHFVRRVTRQSFGAKMATGSESFFRTCAFCWTCSANENT